MILSYALWHSKHIKNWTIRDEEEIWLKVFGRIKQSSEGNAMTDQNRIVTDLF
jgi:hypothetical protein